MKIFLHTSVLIICLQLIITAQNRIEYNGRQLFLNGSNVAWVNFGNDIGPDQSTPNMTKFQQIFQTVHANGGNSLRLWLHTAGTKTPQFSPIASPDGLVIGPGENTISDLKKILDLAYQNEIGMMLCLWSFDMMRTSNGSAYTGRARLMLNDTSATMKYINNALIPMVEALKEHPAILSWEVFNEPEGMSTEFGWPTITSADIPMSNIQRFINLVAGAIHRTDPKAKVTNGSWSFKATTDIPTLAKENPREILESLTDEQKEKIEDVVEAKYRVRLSAESILEEFSSTDANNYNYYRDDRLIASGGDQDGYLDFYTVHWYSTIDGTIKLSPFHYPYSFWNLDKPMVMAEFFMVDALLKREIFLSLNYSSM